MISAVDTSVLLDVFTDDPSSLFGHHVVALTVVVLGRHGRRDERSRSKCRESEAQPSHERFS